jgi:hypothetical protein
MLKTLRNTFQLAILCVGVLAVNLTAAQDTDNLAKAAQNPISDLISLPFQWNSNFEVGPLDKPQHVLNIQPFVNYNFADHPGRYLTFAPVITANWEADSDKWLVPLGLGIGQITKFGKRPVNLQASFYYNVERPDQAARYQVRLQMQLMFPK